MALAISDPCIACLACLDLCPNGAIEAAEPYLRIDPDRCTECAGVYDEPQCAAICPTEGAILDAQGEPLNPPGSLTGIPQGVTTTNRSGVRHA